MRMYLRSQNFNTIFISVLILSFAILGEFINTILLRYADEIFALYALVSLALNRKEVLKNKVSKKILLVTIVTLIPIVIIGLISNISSQLITNIIPIAIDLFSMIKVPIAFVYVFSVLKNNEKEVIINNLAPLARLFIIISFLFGVINLFVDCGMTFDIRYNIRAYTFIYKNPGGLNAALFIAYTIVTYVSKYKADYIISWLALITVCFTLRGVGIGVVGIIIMLKILFHFINSYEPLHITKLLGVIPVTVALGWNQIVEYFVLGTSLRSLLFKNSIIVFQRYFPLGSGFATYGSDQAHKNYSKLYYEFGYNKIYMLDEATGYVANDNFWPMIIAQFGLVGLIAYIFLIYSQFELVLKLPNNSNVKSCALALLCLVFIGSLGNAVYTSSSGMMVYIVLGCILMCKEGD